MGAGDIPEPRLTSYTRLRPKPCRPPNYTFSDIALAKVFSYVYAGMI